MKPQRRAIEILSEVMADVSAVLANLLLYCRSHAATTAKGVKICFCRSTANSYYYVKVIRATKLKRKIIKFIMESLLFIFFYFQRKLSSKAELILDSIRRFNLIKFLTATQNGYFDPNYKINTKL